MYNNLVITERLVISLIGTRPRTLKFENDYVTKTYKKPGLLILNSQFIQCLKACEHF